MVYNPREHLHDIIEIQVPGLSRPGAYFPPDAIALRTGLTTNEERSVLAEELAHHDLYHQPTTDPIDQARQELRARRLAVERLVSIEALANGLVGANYWNEVAESCEVTVSVIVDRLAMMSDNDRRRLRRHIGRLELEL